MVISLGCKMKSIKQKLLWGIILINSLLLVGIFIFTSNFEKFYINHSAKELNSFAKEVENYINGNMDTSTYEKILRLSEDKNINIDIYDKDDSLVLTSRQYGRMMGANSKKKNHKYTIKDEYIINKNLTAYKINEKPQNIDYLSIIEKIPKSKYTLVCKIPISTIESTTNLSSQFLWLIFIPISIISLILTIVFANKFTKPIIKLNKVTNKISTLDFSEKININTKDELSMLGESINILSDKINNTLKDLQIKNKQLENLIENKNNQEKLRKEFVASVSHELKTPITIINGYAQGLKSNITKTKEDRDYYIDVIYDESEKMGIIVNDLLDLYKLESHTFTMKKENINVRELVFNIVKNFDLKIKENKINLKLDVDNINVLGDKVRLGQVLNNFIDNAIYNVDNKKYIHIKTSLEDKMIKISIYNSGKNIKEKDLQNIWDCFVRYDEKIQYSRNKVGLGLAIVKEIIKLHQGEYGVKNHDGGVEFYIKLKYK